MASDLRKLTSTSIPLPSLQIEWDISPKRQLTGRVRDLIGPVSRFYLDAVRVWGNGLMQLRYDSEREGWKEGGREFSVLSRITYTETLIGRWKMQECFAERGLEEVTGRRSYNMTQGEFSRTG